LVLLFLKVPSGQIRSLEDYWIERVCWFPDRCSLEVFGSVRASGFHSGFGYLHRQLSRDRDWDCSSQVRSICSTITISSRSDREKQAEICFKKKTMCPRVGRRGIDILCDRARGLARPADRGITPHPAPAIGPPPAHLPKHLGRLTC
jgi:hypothetical protein